MADILTTFVILRCRAERASKDACCWQYASFEALPLVGHLRMTKRGVNGKRGRRVSRERQQ